MKHTRPDGIDPHARSRARRRALQAVYAWQLSDTPITKVIDQFRNEQDMEVADLEYFEDLVRGVVRLDRQGGDHPLPVWLALPGDLIGIEALAAQHPQFSYVPALHQANDDPTWQGFKGFADAHTPPVTAV